MDIMVYIVFILINNGNESTILIQLIKRIIIPFMNKISLKIPKGYQKP